MAGTYIVNDIIAQKALPHFINNCKALRLANRDYEKEYDKEINGYKVGATVRIQEPSYYPVNDGEVAVPVGIDMFNTDLTINTVKNICFTASNVDLTLDLNMEGYEKSAIMPAMISIANTVDSDIITTMANAIYRNPGTIGNVNSFAKFNNAVLTLDNFAVPMPRFALMNPSDRTTLQNSLQNAFNTTLNEEISIKGLLGELSGVECYWDQNMPLHTNGINSGTPIIAGASQTGSSITTSGWTATQTGILKKGDIFTIAGVYGVNPVPPNNTVGNTSADLAKFIVTADVNSTGGGAGLATIPFSPAIVTTGVYKTVSAGPADGAAITVIDNTAPSTVYSQNFMFSREAITLAIVPMRRPEGAVKVGRATDEKTGVSVRVIDFYDGITNQELKRLDILYGKRCFPQYATKF